MQASLEANVCYPQPYCDIHDSKRTCSSSSSSRSSRCFRCCCIHNKPSVTTTTEPDQGHQCCHPFNQELFKLSITETGLLEEYQASGRGGGYSPGRIDSREEGSTRSMVANLSGGQRQRMSFARAIYSQAKLVGGYDMWRVPCVFGA